MKCHYEVLNVPRDADDAEIKTAYRKLALKWHPDKNLDNSDYAKEQFQQVQQAYEVLSDRQERAWYDNHREQILRGANSEFEDNSLDLFQYFTTSCFKYYDDDEHGFYTTYRTVFEKLIQEELEFLENKDEFLEVPSFGNSKTEYDKVSEFYSYWLNYSTKKSYVWLDPYDIKDIKDRRYLKLVEKENKKVRQKAKKERNEEIRNLVEFIRKRDKRVQTQKKLQEQRTLEDKKKREEWSKQKRLERKQLNESGTQPEWAKFDNVKSELEEIEKHLAEQFGEISDSEEEEELLNNLYCVACNKVFKTPKAFENHESSKKHKENIELLKDQMLEEESAEMSSNISDDKDNYADFVEEPIHEMDQDIQGSVHKESPSESEDIDIEDVDEIKTKVKKKKQRNVLVLNDHEQPLENGLHNTNSEDDFDFGSKKKPKKKNKKNTSQTKQDQKVADEELSKKQNVEEENVGFTSSKKIRKDKKNKNVSQSHSGDLVDVDINHSCVTCKSNFPSKNKLFDHLKKTGHGVYIPSNVKKNRNIKEK